MIGTALAEIATVLAVRLELMTVYRALAMPQNLSSPSSPPSPSSSAPQQTADATAAMQNSPRAPERLEVLASKVGQHVVTLDQLHSPLLLSLLPHVKFEAGLLNHAMCADASVSRQMALPAALSLCVCRDTATMWREHYSDLRTQQPEIIPAAASGKSRDRQSQQQQHSKASAQWQDNRVFAFLSTWVQHLIAKATIYFSLVALQPVLPELSSPQPIAGPAAASGLSLLPQMLPASTIPPPGQIPHLMDFAKHGPQSSSAPPPVAGAMPDLEARFEDFFRRSGVLSAALLLNVMPDISYDPMGYTCRAPVGVAETVERLDGMAAWVTLYAFPEGSFEMHRRGVVSIITQYMQIFVPERFIYKTIAHMSISMMAVEQGVFIVVVAKERKGIERITMEFCVATCRFLRMSDAFSLLRAE